MPVIRMDECRSPNKKNSSRDYKSEPGGPVLIAKPQQEPANTLEASSASVAIRIQYRGIERTIEFPLTPHTIGQLALEARFGT